MAVALLLLVAFLFQGTWALAGTTGGLSGVVTDTKGAPVAGAAVKLVSASQVVSAKTDASGHFSFLSLEPDTYTVSIDKDNFAPLNVVGVTVFADQQQTLTFQLSPQLKTIAKETAAAASSLVKGSVGADIYSVNSSQIAASQSLGGGGNLNSAYSAMSSVPGVNVPIGGSGWNSNVVYVRGSQSFFTGFEYDGVPVNRAFDNYNSSTESNLGLQELQVYTGGGPSSNASSGTSGFINQVIKTGTYPGYATLSGGIASNAFYHQLKAEAGGATPDRRFSYYAGFSGYNQDFRFLDNSNGAGLMGAGGIYSDYSSANNGLGGNVAFGGGALSFCNQNTGATSAAVLASAAGTALNNTYGSTNLCLFPYTGISGLQSNIADRENVINLHFAIPRKDGQRDDLQLLWSGSMLKTQYYGSVNDVGGYNQYTLAQEGVPYNYPGTTNLPPYNLGGLYTGNGAAVGCLLTGGCAYPWYADAWVYNARFGQSIQNMAPSVYLSPDSNPSRGMFSQLPANSRDGIYNDTGIVKMQYTHALGQRAFARLSAYTFYSDWDQTGENSTEANYLFGYPAQALAANYILSTHTTGGEFQLTDEINDKHLLQLTANYTEANVLRDNNNGFAAGGALGQTSPFGLFTYNASAPAGTDPYTCYNPGTGAAYAGCYSAISSANSRVYSAAQVANGFFNPAGGPPAGSAAALAGAQYVSLWDGPTKGSYNTVKPEFLNVSLSDQFRPNDRWLFNLSARYENYLYKLPDSTTQADGFYADIASNYYCYNTTPGSEGVFSAPLLPGQFPPASPAATTQDCNTYVATTLGQPSATGWVHPNGTVQDGVQAPNFTVNSPNSYKLDYWSARFSGTYTQSPDTVWRFSGGRFIEPPISASVQYLDQSGNNTALWANFMGLGFFTPFHNVPAQTASQYDVSLERHIRGTDISFKLTPFYNLTNGYQAQSFIGSGFVTQVPIGKFRSEGVEAAVTKGDFAKNGLSGSLSVTYTDAKVQFQSGLVNGFGVNQIGVYNQAIKDYNALAKGGSQNFACFNFAGANAGTGIGTAGTAATCAAGTVTNPYFNAPQQALLDPSGWYAPTSDVALPGVNTGLGIYDAPWVTTLILNYRKDKLAITPSLQLVSGSSYGSPFTTQGLDPRECTANDTAATDPAQCAWTSVLGAGATQTGLLYVPNWQTGTFDGVGQYRNPNLMVGNIAVSYDLSPKVSLNLTLANVFHTCFGGSKEPWSTLYKPSSTVCGYGANGLQVSNYQSGDGMKTPGNSASYNAAANGTTLAPWQFQSYAPTTGSGAGFIPAPFNAYLTVNVKL
ncbi:MAG: TonB-dependent receptor [bacterium]|nr:TonB-dependent receptor [bacterium]